MALESAPGRKGNWGKVAQDNRRFINAVLWILRTGGTCWPITETGKTPTGRFCRWRDKGQWEGLLHKLMKEPDFEWLMIDASYVKVHAHAAGAVGGSACCGIMKRGSQGLEGLSQLVK